MVLLAIYVVLTATWAVAADFGAASSLPITIQGVFIGDKVVHFAVVGLFSLVVARAVWHAGVRPTGSLITGMVLAAGLATLEEFSNALTPHRTCSFFDLLADYAGILLFTALAYTTGFERPIAWLRYRPTTRPRGTEAPGPSVVAA